MDLLEVKILIYEFLHLSNLTSDFDCVFGRLRGLIRACISDAFVSMLLFLFKLS